MQRFGILAVSIALWASCRMQPNQKLINQDLTFEPPRGEQRLQKVFLEPGRYLGFVRLKDKNLKIPAVFDLVGHKYKLKSGRYSAVLKLSAGGFTASDYRSYYLPEVNYSSMTQEINISASDDGIAFSKVKVHRNSVITGYLGGQKEGEPTTDFILIYAGKRRGIDVAAHLKKVFPKLQPLQGLSGKFGGVCRDSATELVLSNTNQTGEPTPVFHAVFSKADNKICSDHGQPCFVKNLQQGKWDALGSQINFRSAAGPFECKVNAASLTCQDCQLKRLEPEVSWQDSVFAAQNPRLRDERLRLSPNFKIPQRPDFAGVLEGEYFGYLFHESSGLYQLLRLKVSSEKIQEEGMTLSTQLVTGVATLFFGGADSREYIVYRYAPRYYSESSPHFVFNGSGETFMQVSQWNEGALRGIWYSKNWGRVGSVELLRQELPLLSSNAIVIPKLSGAYRGAPGQFNLISMAELSKTRFDFFPMSIRGVAKRNSQVEGKAVIQQASLNLYTNAFTYFFEDKSYAFGKIMPQGFAVFWPENLRIGGILQKPQFESLIYEKDPFSGVTAKQMYQMLNDQSKDIY